MDSRDTQVEYLDPDEFPHEYPDGSAEHSDGETGDDGVAWLDEEHVGSHGSPHRLPPRATRNRLALSAAVFALAGAAVWHVGNDAYQHDLDLEAAQNALLISAVDVGDPVTLVDPSQLGGPGSWRAQPSAAISVGVTNESTVAITLLPGATMLGPGLAQPATLAPEGTVVLQPGQSGRLNGVATVDCAASMPASQTPASGAAPGTTLMVQARTASGAVGVADVGLDRGNESVREQICLQQGSGVASSFFPESVNASAHTFTVTVDAHSLAAVPLRYQVAEEYSDVAPGSGSGSASGSGGTSGGISGEVYRQASLPGVTLSGPVPNGPVEGVLAPGASMTASYTVRVTSCPDTLSSADEDVDLQLFLDYQGKPFDLQADGFDLRMLVAAACGFSA